MDYLTEVRRLIRAAETALDQDDPNAATELLLKAARIAKENDDAGAIDLYHAVQEINDERMEEMAARLSGAESSPDVP